MKMLIVITLLLSLPCRAATCGLFQAEDFGDRILYSIIQLKDPLTYLRAPSPTQTLFTITNPESAMVKTMIRGFCYCVEGEVTPDPEFEGDHNFKLLTVSVVKKQSTENCPVGF